MSNKSVASGKAGEITLMNNALTGVQLYSECATAFDMTISGNEYFARCGASDKTKFIDNVKADVSISFEIFSMPLLSIMFGLTKTTGVTSIFANDLEISPTVTMELTAEPKAGTLYLSKMEDGDYSAFLEGGELTAGDPVNVGEYSITGSTITLNAADLTNPIRAFYQKDTGSDAIKYDFKANDVAEVQGFTLSFVTDWTDANNGNAVPTYIVAENAQPSVNTSISFSAGSVATITMEMSLLPNQSGINFTMTQI